MIKIFDNNNKLVRQDDQLSIYTIIEFLEDNNICCMLWETLSNLIASMTGDSCTTFNTIGEMIKEIPDIVSCGEDCAFLCVIDNDRQGNESKWFILGWNYENDIELCNRILQEYFPQYRVAEN